MTLYNSKLSNKKANKKVRINEYKNQVRILKDVVNHPLDKLNERSDRLWLVPNTIKKTLSKLNTKELRIQAMNDMVAQDVKVQSLVLDEIENRLNNDSKSIATSDLVKVWEFSFKRQRLIDWESTENVANIITSVTIN